MPRRTTGSYRAALAALSLAGFQSGTIVAEEAWRFELPAGFPAPQVPDDNPMTRAKVALGRRLFSDPRLSITGAYACASCHNPALAFTDGRARAVGATGELHPRGAMTLVNVAYHASFGWANPLLRSLEEQSSVPMLAVHPVELGLAGHEAPVVASLLGEPEERRAFADAFPEAAGHFGLEHVQKALAAYERTLLSAASPYDDYVFRDRRDALGDAARRGMALFFSEPLGCARCHPAPLFMSPAVYADHPAEPRFHNTGLYNLDDSGRYPDTNTGLYEHTGRLEDMGRFRVPTLRNVALTAPYMHDGSIATLHDVVRHYAAGGRNRKRQHVDEIGPRSPLQSPDVRAFEIDEAGVSDLVAFLESLTDRDYAAGRNR